MQAVETKETTVSLKVRFNSIRDVVLPIAVLLIISIVFGLLKGNFLSVSNLMNILRQMSILLIVALAGTLVILIGSIDLSVGANVTFTGMLSTYVISFSGAGAGTALLVGVVSGGLVGLINGFLFTQLKLPSFLVTLGTLSSITGLSNLVSKGTSIQYKNATFDYLARGQLIPGLPNIFLWAVACLGLIIFLCSKTVFGRNMYAIGGGEKVAKLSGINANKIKVIVFMMSGLLCGLAGVLMAARIGSGTPRMGDTFLLDSIAAVVIGGTALSGGLGGAHRTIVGVLLIAVMSNGMNIVGIHPFVQDIIKGFVVIGAVAFTIDRSKFELTK